MSSESSAIEVIGFNLFGGLNLFIVEKKRKRHRSA